MWPTRRKLSLAGAGVLGILLTACSGGASTSPSSSSAAAAPSVHSTSTTSALPRSPTPRSPATSHTPATTSATPPPPGPGAAPTLVRGKPGTVTIAVSGDEILHPAVLAAARRGSGWDFTPILAQVAPVIRSADLGICQLETPLGATGASLTHGFIMGGPAAFAPALRKAGFDGCSTANNHTLDQGLAGLRATRTILASAGLQAAGPGPSAGTPGQPATYHAKGFTIAQLSYSYTLDNTVGNTRHVPPAAPWAKTNLYDVIGPSGIEADARAARAKGADLVLVSMHWGEEQDPHPTAEQRRFATELLSSGTVDYIIGNHPHVVQPCQRIDGRMVNYSLGNALSDQTAGIVAYGGTKSTAAAQDGVIALVTFHRDAAGHVTSSERIQPTRVDRAGGYVIRLATQATDPASWQRTTSVIESGGNRCGVQPVRTHTPD